MLNEGQFEKMMHCDPGKLLLKCLLAIHFEKTSSLIHFSKKLVLEAGVEFLITPAPFRYTETTLGV